ncbi:DUF397 domain-containing protein [Actinopolyspora sp. H202]|uniref:DUF397 domain-containing protein n=1 Tax=Actinopolyspora sp. H202 TaxID=1500456 RepID=UPI003EE4E33B
MSWTNGPGDWRTSTRSAGQGNCVEVAVGSLVGVRDTKDRGGGMLTFTAEHWSEFLDELKHGGFGRMGE